MSVSLVKHNVPSVVTLVKRAPHVRVWRALHTIDGIDWQNMGIYSWDAHLEALSDFRALDMEYGCVATYTATPVEL